MFRGNNRRIMHNNFFLLALFCCALGISFNSLAQQKTLLEPVVTNALLEAMTKNELQAEANNQLTQNQQATQDGTGRSVPKYHRRKNNEANRLIANRVAQEESNLMNAFALTPHNPNYILPFHYQSNVDTTQLLPENEATDKVEFVFQLSLKVPVITDIFGPDTDLWAAYTQKSIWQAYNTDSSSPFRETNYAPELFIATDLSANQYFLKPDYVTFGFNHQSNGRRGDASRSWNRIFAQLFYEMENTVIAFKPWYRLPENPALDDNPNIEQYYGYGEMNVVHVFGNYTMEFMLRNNLRSDNRGAVQLGLSFPLLGKTHGYIQYFNGYGQSLIEYDQHTQSLSMGILLTTWL